MIRTQLDVTHKIKFKKFNLHQYNVFMLSMEIKKCASPLYHVNEY